MCFLKSARAKQQNKVFIVPLDEAPQHTEEIKCETVPEDNEIR